MKKLFLVIGAPGSGKTTDASMIAANNEGIAHYSTGDMLRAEVASGSALGNTIDSFVSKGELVPLEIVIDTVINAVKNCEDSVVIIDGFPRSVEQMEALDKELCKIDYIELASVIEVYVSEQTAKERVLDRARGADDNEEVFYNRMKVYTEPLAEIQKFYQAKNLHKVIDGERTIEAIVQEMENFIKSKI